MPFAAEQKRLWAIHPGFVYLCTNVIQEQIINSVGVTTRLKEVKKTIMTKGGWRKTC